MYQADKKNFQKKYLFSKISGILLAAVNTM